MYSFLPSERVECYGHITTLADVWALAEAQGKPYVCMLDGCGLGNGVVWPADREKVLSDLQKSFSFGVQVFERADAGWQQFSSTQMRERLGLRSPRPAELK